MPDGKYRYSSLIIPSSGYSGPHSLPRSDLLPVLYSEPSSDCRRHNPIFSSSKLVCSLTPTITNKSDQTSNNNKIINVDHDIMKKARCVFINFEFLIKLLVRFAELLAEAEKSKHLENREFEINPRLEA